jgi:hypothetical protein
MDIAKRLLDFGIHAPTTYFPLLVPECLLIEPTETESRETHGVARRARATGTSRWPGFCRGANIDVSSEYAIGIAERRLRVYYG